VKTPQKPRRPKRPAGARKAKVKAADGADWAWADPNSLQVNPEFRRLIPLQSRGEYLALSDSIKEEGCRDPLLVWKGHNVVLDGHTRRDLCIEHGQKAKVREVELPDEQAAVEFILRIQRQRRNLTREAMSYFRGSDYNAVKQRRGGSRRGRRPKGQSDPLISTARQLAEKYGVSEKTVKRDGAFALVIDKIAAEHEDPEVKRKLLGADVRLTHGLARLLLRMPSDERKAAVAQLLEQGELPRARKKERAAARQPRQVAQSLVERLKAKGEEHARAVLEQMARLLGLEVSEKRPEG
jgi:hypothetical protein